MWFLVFAPLFAARRATRLLPRRRCSRGSSTSAATSLSGLAIVACFIGVFTLPDGWWSGVLLLLGWIVFPIVTIICAARSHRQPREPSERETPSVRRFASFVLNTVAILGLTIGSVAALCTLVTLINAAKGEISWKYCFIAFAVTVATLPASVWLFNRTHIREEPEPPKEFPPDLVEPSPKLPPDDGPLNPRMFYSDRR